MGWIDGNDTHLPTIRTSFTYKLQCYGGIRSWGLYSPQNNTWKVIKKFSRFFWLQLFPFYFMSADLTVTARACPTKKSHSQGFERDTQTNTSTILLKIWVLTSSEYMPYKPIHNYHLYHVNCKQNDAPTTAHLSIYELLSCLFIV